MRTDDNFRPGSGPEPMPRPEPAAGAPVTQPEPMRRPEPAPGEQSARIERPAPPKTKLPQPRLRRFFSNHRVIFVTFGLAFAIMTFGFAASLMFPLGDRQIMVIDSWHQYYPFLQVYHHKLHSFGSLFYTHDIGLGTNFWLLMSYYLNSPVNLLSVLFPAGMLREFMMLATTLKISLAASFFAIYLRDRYRRSDRSIVAFSLMYGFCAYMMGYYWNIMWLDTVALLPLVVLGMHRILRGGRPTLYVITLALSITSNYYIGYMTCVFVAAYYIYLALTVHRADSFRGFVAASVKMVFFSVLGVGVSAVVLLPTYRGMLLASSASFTFPSKLSFDRPILDVVNNMLVGNPPAVVRGLPNVYSGFLSLIMLYYYFRAPSIRLSEKIGSFLLLLFLMLGFNTNILNFMWHGFHYPNEIPHRFAYVFSFVVVSLAYRGFTRINQVQPRAILTFLSVTLIYLIFGEKGPVSRIAVFATMFAAIVYCSVLWRYFRGDMPIRRLASLLLILVVVESTASAVTGVAVTGHSKRSSYKLYNSDIQKGLAQIRADDPGDYRIEMARIYSVNDAALYGYRGAGCFTSTANANVTRFLQNLGVAGNAPSNRYSVTMSTPILDSMLGIKYFIGRNELGDANFAGKTEVFRSGSVRILQNDYYLPHGFFVAESIRNYESVPSGSPFDAQEDFLDKALCDYTRVYIDVPLADQHYDNIEVSSVAGGKFHYKQPASGSPGKVTLTYEFPEDGDYVLFVDSGRTQNAQVSIYESDAVSDDAEEQSLRPRSENYEVRRGVLIPTGTMRRGGKIVVRFETEKGTGGSFHSELVRVDMESFDRAYQRLEDGTMRLDVMKDTYISGQIRTPQAGYVYLSIPYEKGWSAKVNGVPVEIETLKDAMMLIPVRMGVSVIELQYMPDGFLLGLMLSSCSAAALVLIVIPVGRRNRRAQKPSEPSRGSAAER